MSDPVQRASGARGWRVALTGGIASGKSTVALLFEALGVPIIDADLLSREVMAPGTALLGNIFERFGAHLRLPDGSLDRGALRRIVFADADRRRQLEAMVQPAIRDRSEQLASLAQGPYLIYVIPLLVETRAHSRFERVLVVDCAESVQLQRLLLRDGCDLTQARAILAAQASREQRLAVADDVIVNDATPQALQSNVASLHDKYQGLATEAARLQH
jgi:dephospho-CoA kinase